MQSHAYVPTPILENEKVIRVFVAFLDRDRIGRLGFVDVEAENPLKVLGYSERPVLDIGVPGRFDDSGVTPMCVIDHGNERLLYYNGWQRSVGVPYHIFSGLAISVDGGSTFDRFSDMPILDRTDFGALVRSSPFVVAPASPGEAWRMWYNAGRESFHRPDGWAPIYGLRYVESSDGKVWRDGDRSILEPRLPDEFGLARPWVRRTSEGWTMLYSARSLSAKYRIGRARSKDNRDWSRCEDDSLSASNSGWDSEMVAFSSVITTRYGTYCFYNGNGYGRTGFGVAVHTGGGDW
jgi:predicted GH43/DUF377 family glycosyl hydrolase